MPSGEDTTGEWKVANSKRKRAKSTITTKNSNSLVNKGEKQELLFTFDEELNEPVKTAVAPIETKKNPTKDLADSKIASIVVVTPKKRTTALKEENKRFIQPHSRKSKFANEINATINDELEYFEEDIRKPKAPKVKESVALTTTPFEPKATAPVIIPIKPKKEKANQRRKSKIPNTHRSEVGWVIKNSPSPGTSPSPSPTPSPASSPSDSLGVSPKKGHPSRSLLEENGFEQQKYEQFRARCMRGKLFYTFFFFTFF